MVKLNEDFMETDNGVIREYNDLLSDIKRMSEDADWDFDIFTDGEALDILEDMASSDKGIVKLGKILTAARNAKNSLEDAHFELDSIYEMLADWNNLRL